MENILKVVLNFCSRT